jgi:hypothetical protein
MRLDRKSVTTTNRNERKELTTMNQRKTAGQNVSLRKTLLVLVAGLAILSSQAAAQPKLGDLVAEAGFDWMVGRWTGTTDDGQNIEVVYRWGLDKHLVSFDFKMGDYAYQGMIFYLSGKDEVVEVGVDNEGGTAKGTWSIEYDKAISKSERTQAYGEIMRVAIIHSKVDAKTMKVELRRLDSSGEVTEESFGTLEFKRQKRQPRKKTGQTTRDGSKSRKRAGPSTGAVE